MQLRAVQILLAWEQWRLRLAIHAIAILLIIPMRRVMVASRSIIATPIMADVTRTVLTQVPARVHAHAIQDTTHI